MESTFWEQRWQQRQTGWDLGQPSPPLTAYLDQIPAADRAALRVLIPGCGNAHEAIWMMRHGFHSVTLIDIAPTAVQSIQEVLAGLPDADHLPTVLCGDFFTHEAQYDLILEQTFFCAIDPAWRDRYVQKMAALLAPGGKLAGVLFDRDFEGGPPFGGSRAEYEERFRPYFSIKTMAPCYNSIPPRAGTELFILLRALPLAAEA